MTVLNLPNLVSASRILLGPACIVLLTAGPVWALWLALAVMVVAEITDYLDGVLARARRQVSRLGKILDPFADSFYRVSVFLAFVENAWMPIWMFAIIVLRDIAVSHLRLLSEQGGATLGALQSGKWKAVFQSVAQIAVVVLYAAWGGIDMTHTISYGLLLITTLVTAYSLVDYLWTVFKSLNSETY